jgi:hypothetical protein
MTHTICDSCETVAHCLKSGCVPVQPWPDFQAREQALDKLAQVNQELGLYDTYKTIPVIPERMEHLSIGRVKPNYNICFHNHGQEIGKLDFNGPELVFTGNAEQSALVFIDWVAKSFVSRLEQERKRPWVGLTDEERDHIWNVIGNSDAHGDVDGWSGRDVMSAIEAKLREKNT